MKVEAYIHSLKDRKTDRNVLGRAKILKKIGDNLFLAKVNGIYCTAIFNPFVSRYFADDLYGVLDVKEIPSSFNIKNARNLAAGSIRLLDPSVCKDRCIYFYAFNVIEGMDALEGNTDSRGRLLEDLEMFGFGICPFTRLSNNVSPPELESKIEHLKTVADAGKLPIDGLVLRYDSISYSRTLGRTGHHYKDGIAFKFADDRVETVFRSIEWTPGRSGEIAPVALFDPVEIDGCTVSRASLHNLSFIMDLELHPGCRILVSKRNMIIPHIEENLDRGRYASSLIPKRCPCCGKPTRIYARSGGKGKQVATLHCDDPDCGNQTLRKFVHFAEKKAMDISGISEAILDRFISEGFLTTYQDLYHLDRYRGQIIRMEGLGEKSYEKLMESIAKSRKTTFARYVTAMDIPMIGRTASRELERYFSGDLSAFEQASQTCEGVECPFWESSFFVHVQLVIVLFSPNCRRAPYGKSLLICFLIFKIDAQQPNVFTLDLNSCNAAQYVVI